MIETLWLLYANHVQVPPGGTQWIETRRAFFGGAATLFETIMLRRRAEGGDGVTPAERARKIAERAIGRCEQTTSSGRSVACADCIAEVVADVVAAQAAQTRALAAALFAYRARLYGYCSPTDLDQKHEAALGAALPGAPREPHA